MLGLKAAATRNKGRRNDTVNPKDIPGFSKWITSEVYIEDKIAESSLEQLTLNMIENIEWINEAMNDVTSNITGVSLSDAEAENDEEEADLQNKEINFENKQSEKDQKDVNTDEAREGDDILLRTADNSILLLKSPRRIREQKSSPIQHVRRRELELIKDTTALVLNLQRTDENQNHDIGRNAAIDNKIEVKREEVEDFNLPMGNLDDSFELISRDIRKSFAAKQKTTVKQTSDEEGINDNGTGKAAKELQKSGSAANPTGTKSSLTKSSSSEPPPNRKMKSPEDEIKELSRLIDGVNDDLLSDAEDEDLSIELDKLEKIELSQLNRKPTIQEYKSPIKFSEMPMIEPLTLESSRKKSLRRTMDQQKQQNSRRKSNSHRSSTTQVTTIFDEDSGKRRSYTFQLNPLPNEMFSVGNTSVEEPTIKLDRNFTKSIQTNRLADTHIKRAASSESGKRDLLSRLMQPTEASKQRARETTMSPKKSQKTSNRSSPKVSESRTVVEDENVNLNHKSEKGELGTVPSALKVLEAPKSTSDSVKHSSPVKRQVPLTKKSLKSSANYGQLYSGKILEGDTDAASGRFYQETLGLSKKRVVVDSKLPTASSISDRRRLKSMSKGSSRLNYQTEQASAGKLVKTFQQAKDTGKTASGVEENENILPDVIPYILSENEAPEDEREEKSLNAGISGDSNDWTSEKSILRQLKLQLKTNPGPIFGPISAVDCDKLFGKKFGPGMNITWDSKDRLGAAETDAYERAMGWK